MLDFREEVPIPYTLEEDLEILLSDNFSHKKVMDKYSFYPTLLIQYFQFKYVYFRDSIVQKISLELLQNLKYYHEYPCELNKPVYEILESFIKELMIKYLIENKATKTNA